MSSFYDLVIDPLSSQFNLPSQGDDRSSHRTQVPRHHGIPGRYNDRRANKRSRAHLPPFRGSCVRCTPSVDKKPKKKKTKPGAPGKYMPPKRLARYKLACRRGLAKSLVHHFVDPANDDHIGQDFDITSIFGYQIDFS